MALFVEIVSPEAALWSGPASALVARSSAGLFTVLDHHTALVGDLVAGVVRVQTTEGEISFAVHGGYFQVGPGPEPNTTLATVLAGVAERTTEIDLARAQIAKEAAEAQLASVKGDELDGAAHFAALQALERAQLRLRVGAKTSGVSPA
ncbi:MAG TPA: ATP synthase F1 subunit epsilon [Acidimicrobiales bacterium]|nr:ATP synthase F1 subunit epsilon [Acidimicrobiales bacterium]